MTIRTRRGRMVAAFLSVVFFIAAIAVYKPISVSAQSHETVRPEREARPEIRERPLYREQRAAEYRDDEIIVKLRGTERPIRVQNTDKISVEKLVERYAKLDSIEYAEPNYIAYALYTPNDPYYSFQWNFDNPDYGGVHAETGWDTSNGSGAVVAVIDTGVAYENYSQGRRNRYYQAPDLAGTNFVDGYDFVNNDSHPNDDEGHGTHVAGTIAQTTGNGVGVTGLAYGASIMPIKALNQNGSGSYADIADAVRYAADNGADVINMSLGGSAASAAFKEALKYAYEKGVTIVAAAGNNGAGTVSYPAAYDEYVIAVGATRYDETRAPYSNYGSSLDIVAPGGDTSVDQNGDGYGDGILQQTFGNRTSSFGYYFYEGTSMASPHVAAAAALVISAGVASTPDGVRTALESTADDLGPSGRDTMYGHGLLNVAAALGASVEDPAPEPEPEPEDNPPTILISSPNDADTISGPVVITAEANDDTGVTEVEFYIDDELLESDASDPYGAMWDTETVNNGSHTVTAVAYDTIEQTDSVSIQVTVDNSVPEPLDGEVLFSESFENGLSAWTEDSQNDWNTSNQRATDGNRSAEVDGRANDAALISLPIDLSGNSGVTISFSWFIERSLDSGEYLAFDVSTNGGTNWTMLDSLDGNQDAENIWHDFEQTLSDISSLQIRLRGNMNRSNEDANVDNIRVIASN